jgi:2-desacetyl-2-hydroxyethyl bacteriochlorophyllide A dehydrogenase
MTERRTSDEAAKAMSQRRSQGQIVVARALWYVKPGEAEIRTERLGPVRPGEARVATYYSGLSRGTERLVANGDVPQSEWQHMRAPLQAGVFPFPVKYGYSATGVVTAGPEVLIGRHVFALHPHQDHFQVAADMLFPLPDGLPPKRATLAANMETALNAHWDAGTGPGDKVLVVGAGVVGLLVAHLAQRIAGTQVAITDIDSVKAGIAEQLGLKFINASEVTSDNAIVFHTSATGAGLDTAIDKCAFEGRVIEMSWYGAKPVSVRLGGAFHSRRLTLISSQVGHVAPSRRDGTSRRDRLLMALSLLDDARLDALVSDEIAFDDVAARLLPILNGSAGALAPVIRYTQT